MHVQIIRTRAIGNVACYLQLSKQQERREKRRRPSACFGGLHISETQSLSVYTLSVYTLSVYTVSTGGPPLAPHDGPTCGATCGARHGLRASHARHVGGVRLACRHARAVHTARRAGPRVSETDASARCVLQTAWRQVMYRYDVRDARVA